MKRLDNDEIKAFTHLAAHNEVVVNFFEEWYRSELEGLPKAKDNFALNQGRCQVLQEIQNILQKAPEWERGPQARPTVTAHTDRSV